MDIFYASHDGHSAKIAFYLAEHLKTYGVPAEARDLSRDYPADAEIDTHNPCVLISAIRYGFHRPLARKLLNRIAPLTPHKPLILLSVNLTARKPGKRGATTNAYLRKWIKRSGAKPLLAEAIAGKLDYPRYTMFDRMMIRLIMKITGGPTDPKAIVDYTDWTRIEDLAAEIIALWPTITKSYATSVRTASGSL